MILRGKVRKGIIMSEGKRMTWRHRERERKLITLKKTCKEKQINISKVEETNRKRARQR